MVKKKSAETSEGIVERVIAEERARFDFKGEVEVKQGSGFEGRIECLANPKVTIEYPAEYVPDEVMEKEVVGSFEKCVRALVQHEFNHKGGGEYGGCPRTKELHLEEVLEPSAEVLQDKGFPNVPVVQGHTLYSYFANLHEDVLDNFEVARAGDPAGVFGMYHYDVKSVKKFTPLFDAFVSLQEWLCADKRSKRLMWPYHGQDKRVQGAVDAIITRLGFDKVTKKVWTRRKKVEYEVIDKDKILGYCLDEKNWQDISRVFTEEFAKLVDINQLSRPEYVKEMFVPLKGRQDGFKQEVDNPETLLEQVWKKYLQSKGQFDPPAYISKNKSLALLYRKLARNMEIKTRASVSSSAYPAVRFGWRQFDPEVDNVMRARVAYEGRLILKARKFTEDEPAEYHERKKDIPKIRLVLRDDSNSTRDSVPSSPNKGIVMNPWAPAEKQWTDKSRYHYMLIAEATLEEFLRKQGVLKHSTYKSVSFSSDTRVAADLESSANLRYNPTFQGTMMDMKKLRKVFGKGELVYVLTDGWIENWDSESASVQEGKKATTIGEEYIRKVKENFTIHIYIGSKIGAPKSIQDIEKAGLPVYYDSGENVSRIIIDLTRPYVTKRAK